MGLSLELILMWIISLVQSTDCITPFPFLISFLLLTTLNQKDTKTNYNCNSYLAVSGEQSNKIHTGSW